MTHLRPKQEYIDQYDRITIEDCRWRENFHKNYKSPNAEKTPELQAMARRMGEFTLYYDLFFATLYWWEKKEKTIQGWMDTDKHRDDMLETARPPASIRCLKCFTPLTSNHKTIDDIGGKKERVMFFFDCPSGCLPSRIFFDDGEERRVKEPSCPKCETLLDVKHKRIRNKKIVTTKTCSNCGYTDKYEFELGEHKEPPDPNFEKDRDRFCLTEAAGKDAQQARFNMEGLARLVDEWKKKDKHKEEYQAVEKLRKLTVVELEGLLVPVIEAAGYMKLQFGTPEMGRNLLLPFTVHDAKAGRTNWDSIRDLRKLIREALADTNWRPLKEPLSYRLGILTGRLRAYEREEDLLALVSKKDHHEKETGGDDRNASTSDI